MFGRLSPRRLKAMVGKEVGRSDWFVITQERVNAFAEAAEDRQWIHVDLEKAARGPLGGTVAHGALLLALLPHFNLQNEVLTGRLRYAVNYGFNRVRFPQPVRVGSRVRNRAVLKAVERRGFHKVLVTVENTVEIEGEEKPAMVAEMLGLLYL